MKKAILIAALFAVAGIASAQDTASTPAAKPAETMAKAEGHKKAHAKKHVKHAAKKNDQAKADDTGMVAKASGAGADQKTTSAPAK